MIVNPHPEGWEIVSHYTHGLLAGKIAIQLKHGLRPDFWEDILTAVIEHDDHMLDFGEKDYLTGAGAPLDFTLDERSDDDAYEHAERVYRAARQKSQLVALLIGRHLEFLYHGKIREHRGFKKFFESVKKDRKNQLRIYDWKKTTLESSYSIMRFCDRCSLVLCQDLVPSSERKLEVNTSIDGKTYYIWGTNNRIHVAPWPFEKDAFLLHFELRRLKKLAFRSNGDLEKELMDTMPELKEIQMVKDKK